jgi:hypothetical protein
MTDLISIREEGVTLQVISEWAPWSPCKQCVFRRGIRTSRGYCRLKRTVNWASHLYFYSSYCKVLYNKSYNSLFLHFILFHFIKAYIIILDNGRKKRHDCYTFLPEISNASLQVNIHGIWFS